MKTQTCCLIVLTGLFAGCWQKSIHPFYFANDVIAEPKLAGTWRQVDESDASKNEEELTWTLTPRGEKEFDLVALDKRERHEYEARVFKLGERRYIDIVSKIRGLSTIPSHHLFQITELGAELKVTMLNADWMQRWLSKHPGSLAHTIVADPEHPSDRTKDEVVLLADTKALQNFIRDHLKDSDFFSGEIVLKKQSVAAKPQENK